MPRKGKHRREERRKRHQQMAAAAEDTGEPQAGRPAPSAPAARAAPVPRRPKAQAVKAGHVRLGPWEPRVSALSWVATLAVAVVGVGVLAYLILSSGSSGVSAPPAATRTPDPRVAGLTPALTLNVDATGAADDARFSPDAVTANAGEPFEIIVKNAGSVSHDLRIAGRDGEYETPDDWVSDPDVIKPGEEGRLLVKLDEAGAYAFRCDFHPLVQVGTLTVE